jgi:hypothetical protein
VLHVGRAAAVVCCVIAGAPAAAAHPVGNLSFNHYARVVMRPDGVRVRYVVDLAEIAAFQEKQRVSAAGGYDWSEEEREAYRTRETGSYAEGLRLSIDGRRVPLEPVASTISTPPGFASLPTLRLVVDLVGRVGALREGARVRFEDTNHPGRPGWHELVVASTPGLTIFDSTAFGSGVTDELAAYPDDLMAPLDERVAEWLVTTGAAPPGARPLRTRDGRIPIAAEPGAAAQGSHGSPAAARWFSRRPPRARSRA